MSEQTPPETPELEPAVDPAATPEPRPRRSIWRLFGRLVRRTLHVCRHPAGGRLRHHAHRGPRSRRARHGRARRRQLPQARLHHRPAVDPPAYRPLRRRGSAHRRPRKGSPAVSGRQVDRRLDGLQRAGASRGAGRLRADDRLEDGRGDVAQRPPQLPEVHARANDAAGAQAVRDHGDVRGRRRRRVPLRGSRRAVEHRRAQSRGHRQQDDRVRRHGEVHATAPSRFSSTCRCRRTWTASSPSTARS